MHPGGYGYDAPPHPPMTSYAELPAPAPHHYRPPVKTYGEAPRPKPHPIVPVKTYAPAPMPAPKSYGARQAVPHHHHLRRHPVSSPTAYEPAPMVNAPLRAAYHQVASDRDPRLRRSPYTTTSGR